MSSASQKRQTIAALAAERSRQGGGRRFLNRVLAIAILLLLLGGPVLWALGFFSPPQAVAEVQKLVDQQVAEYARVARGEVPFEAAPSFEPLMEKMRGVPREYRAGVGEQMGRLWQARERAEMASYFKLPPAQRQAELDRRIKADEARRKAREAEREKRSKGQPAGERTAGDRAAGSQSAQPNQQAQRQGPPGAGPGGTRTEDSRNDWRKRRIDQTSPESRAQQTEYRRAMDARRKELGLPTGGRRG